MFTNEELIDMQNIIDNQVALKPMTPELFAVCLRLTNRIDTELHLPAPAQHHDDLALVCQDCGEAFDDLDAPKAHQDQCDRDSAEEWIDGVAVGPKYIVSTRGEQF